ncbi:MAG: septum formation inhibitor-activating ATPase-like protein [Clostridiales bacterium]|jgi:MinD-like ATPase involved in chromosome partitioning or flagellar assembly/DNA-binding NarL/FixJ family response regulator|nr:septum formation inhibitor-activating ATPase-like protein [Clostridiales bacterium]
MRNEGEAVSLVLASLDADFMMDLTQGLQEHPQIKVIGFAQNGSAAIDRASKMAADAVLTEYALTDITANEMAKRLAEESPGTLVFAISENITAQLVQSAKAVGVKEIFPKNGFSAKETANRIAQMVDEQRREWSEVARTHGAVEKGTGPRGQKIKTEYVTRAITQSVIMTYNIKGGVGKTTIAVNLATAIKMSPYLSGQRVVLVDFDCGGSNVRLHCGLNDNECYNRNLSIWQYVEEGRTTAADMDDLLLDGPLGIKVLPAPMSKKEAEKINNNMELCEKVLRVLKKYFGIIVIDCAPNLSPMTDVAMDHATHILLIANPEGQAVKKLSELTLLLRKDEDNPDKPDMSHLLRKMRIVLNHKQPETKWDLKPSEIAENVGVPVFAEIPYSESVLRALHDNRCKQAVEIDGGSPFAVAIKQMANDLTGAYPEAVGGERSKRGGLFGKFFKKR